jgi:hypothetical protein
MYIKGSPGEKGTNMLIINAIAPPTWGRGWGEVDFRWVLGRGGFQVGVGERWISKRGKDNVN